MKIRAQNTHDVSVLPVLLLLAGSKGGGWCRYAQSCCKIPRLTRASGTTGEHGRRVNAVFAGCLSHQSACCSASFLLQSFFLSGRVPPREPKLCYCKPPTSLEPCPNCLHRTAEGTSWCVLGGAQGQGGQPGRTVEQLNAGPGYATHASGSPPVQVKPSIELIHRPIGPSIHTSHSQFHSQFTLHRTSSPLSTNK